MAFSKIETYLVPAMMVGVILVSGCTPQELESTPVTVETPSGNVVCQLYTRDMVYWDRAIHVPTGMSANQADEICRERGHEWKRSGR